MKGISKRPRDFALSATLVCVSLIAYFPSLRGGLLWDDDRHVTMPFLRSVHGLWRIWFDLGATQQYYPLLHSAFWIEHRLWGDTVLGYHLVNLVLHIGAALLVVAIVRKLGLEAAAWPAGFLFALHPVSVEAVAWISEQKSTLSAVFYFGSALLYLDFDRTRKHSKYALALVLFILALLSKSVTATLPAALLLVFWWQRGRLDWKRDARPLLPWFAIGVTSELFTAWVERRFVGAEGTDYDLSWLDRILLAGRVVWFYLGKLVFPAKLMFFYPHWNIDASQWWQYLFTLSLLALIGVLVWLAKTRRGPLAALLFFLGTLFPVLGFLNVYPFIYSYVADHFTYIASLGVIIPVAVVASRSSYGNALLVAALAVLTWRETRMYKDVETLYTESLQRNPSSWISHDNLGVLLLEKPGGLGEAVGHFQAALALKPSAARAHNNLGSAYSRLGRLPDSIGEFETALKFSPNFVLALNNLGSALSNTPGHSAEAVGYLQKAVSLQPDFADAHNNLGTALSRIPGRMPDAIAEYQLALQLDPDSAEAHNNLARAFSQTPGRMNEAVAEFEAALHLKPDSAEAHSNLGSVLTAMGRLPDAVAHLQAALRLNANLADAHTNLGLAYSKIQGRIPDAIEEYRKALELNPNQPDAHNDLAIALAQSGKKSEALPHFEAAVQNEPDSLQMRINLGNALLDAGRLQDAVSQFEATVKMEPNSFAPHFLLGLALLRVPARGDEALSQIEAALRIRPDPDAQRLVDRMRRERH